MKEKLLQEIKNLNPWFYNLKINGLHVIPGIKSPHSTQQLIDDAAYKKIILIDKIIKKYDFKNKRILDVGSNCGYWSSFYAKAGATYLLAVEGREKFIRQGRLYWEHGKFLPSNQYEFLLGDVTSDDTWREIKTRGPFHFILIAGLLYHIEDHSMLLSKANEECLEAMLIDTRISETNNHKAKPFVERGNWKFDGIWKNNKPAIAAHPTLEFLKEFFDSCGYQIERIFADVPVYKTMSENDNYTTGKRITLLCKK